jgi:YidC/Oxa1 family membrane protein insertase
MSDIRRTLLWVVFTMSLILLWDGWNRHTGQPSLFGAAAPRPAASTVAASPPSSGVPSGVPSASPVATATPSAAPSVTPTAPGATGGEETVVTTDLVRATFDSQGGNLVKLELLNHKDAEDQKRNVMLFDRSAERIYKTQSGLAAQTGMALPNHFSPMRRADGPTSLATGSNVLVVRYESAGEGGVKLAKTFTFTRGSYLIGVRHDVSNGGTTAVSPQLYLGLERDGNPARGESKWYFTFTGPAIYTEAKK